MKRTDAKRLTLALVIAAGLFGAAAVLPSWFRSPPPDRLRDPAVALTLPSVGPRNEAAHRGETSSEVETDSTARTSAKTGPEGLGEAMMTGAQPPITETRDRFQRQLIDLIFLHANRLDAIKGRNPTREEAKRLKSVLHYGRDRLEALKREELVTDYEAAQLDLLLLQFERKLLARGVD